MPILRSFFQILASLVIVTILCCSYALYVEPEWLAVRDVTINQRLGIRIAVFADIHYRGDRDYLEKVVASINESGADMACFAGDLVENREYLPECLELLTRVKMPLYGVPGNHDEWAHVPDDEVRVALRKTGGDWLLDQNVLVLDDRVELVGSSMGHMSAKWLSNDTTKVLLTHYPSSADELPPGSFDLILAGHSHGGQVRVPVFGALIVPFSTPYDRGLFKTPAGPLYVNPGIGTFFVHARFACRPEVTIIEL